MRVLELYAGLGGFAAATLGTEAEVVCACDVSRHVLDIHDANFDHPSKQLNLEGASRDDLARFDADMWWMSPPCQPYTVRGHRKDLDDPRALSFVRVLDAFADVQPEHLAMENVAGFEGSDAHALLLRTMEHNGYAWREIVLCPTELGIPNRRPRYYLAASRTREPAEFDLTPLEGRTLSDYLEDDWDESLRVSDRHFEKYGEGFHIVDADDPAAESACFTGAYGKSWVYSGSYIRLDEGVRFFSPAEVAAIHHLPAPFHFPDHISRRQSWKFLGNSLSVEPVRRILASVLNAG